MADALQTEQLEQLRRGVDEVIAALVAADPEGAVGGGAGGLPHRYSFGGTSVSRHMFHRPEWAQLIDLPTTTPILTSIFASPDYIVYGCGGDLALPGAIEYQGLHSDTVWSEIHDPQGGLTMRDLPTPVIAVNFPTIDLTPINGPIRIIPGTHRSNAAIPTLADEPEWMRLEHRLPASGRLRHHPRRPLLALGHTQPVERRAGDARCRIHGPLVPQRSPHPLDVLRHLVETLAPCPADQPLHRL